MPTFYFPHKKVRKIAIDGVSRLPVGYKFGALRKMLQWGLLHMRYATAEYYMYLTVMWNVSTIILPALVQW